MFVPLALLLATPLYQRSDAAPPARAGAPASGLHEIPSWAACAVWYQIFPERFRNGDPSNDPAAADIEGSWPHEPPPVWHVSLWTADWYRLQSWETSGGKGFYFRAQQRRYGGDIRGMIDRLGYIADLGINAIYINPLFDSPSLHKYDATTYHHIDHNFGPDPEGDLKIAAREDPADPATWRWTSADTLFLRFLREAHAKGIRVIIDGVFNHVGTRFWAFRDVRKNGPASPYRDWFSVIRWDNPATPEDEFDYTGWAGTKDLPEFKRDSTGLSPGPAGYIHAIVRRWMDPDGNGDPSDGIDGWRLDAAEKVPMPFWRTFRTWVREINPEAYITGEIWWEDWPNEKMFHAAPWLRGDAFDAVMNYRWARETCRFFIHGAQKTSATEFDRRLRDLRNEYPAGVNPGLMNLLDSHDTDRLGSMIVNADERYDHRAGAADNPAYDVRKPNAAELRVQKLMVLFQMTYLGAPMIYYGDEAGMWGGDDPDERKPMLWEDMTFEDEKSHPFGKTRPDDRNVFDRDMCAYYRSLIAIRKSSPSLTSGDYATLRADDREDLYAFIRSSAGERTIVVLNGSNLACKTTIAVETFPGLTPFQKMFGDGTVSLSGGTLNVSLPACSGIILRSGTR